MKISVKNKLPEVIGVRNTVKLATSKETRVVMLNNAATTPPFKKTLEAVRGCLNTYGAFHRGSGPHANITYQKTQEALLCIRKFLGMHDEQALLFTTNTSSAINLFIRLLKLKKGDIILTSTIEHTSNNLPWLYNTDAETVLVSTFEDGSLDYEDLERKCMAYGERIKLVSFTGASNVSGYVPDIARIANLTHGVGALLFVDAAQLAPHRQISMARDGIDALAFSAHKLYAPFGLGVLALPRKVLETTPVDPGGGSIDMISEESVIWSPYESRHQTGTWNIPGITATATSCELLMKTGWDNILRHERELVKYAVNELSEVKGLTLYISRDKYLTEDRIGTITFNLAGYHHALLTAILENEYGIETRAGTICNHRLVRRWLKVNDKEQKIIEEKIKKGDRLASYGIVRISLAIHNTKQDIDALVSALNKISKTGNELEYIAVPEEESFVLNK